MKLNVDDLTAKGLVKKKTYEDGAYKGLSVLKYTRKVFYDNLWHLDERLLECRGTVVDEEDNVVVLPFKKVFNYGENGTSVDPEKEVILPEKINGFMAAATMTDKYGLIVSTTGTLDSEFSKLARGWIEKGNYKYMRKGLTYLFEICDKSDLHIVPEDEGAYLIGVRDIRSGKLWDELSLKVVNKDLGYKRPNVIRCKFKDIPETKREGFMVRDFDTEEVLCKLKSPYYLSTKALLRMGKNRTNLMFNNPLEFKKQIDEEFYDFHQYILDNFTAEDYYNLHQENRRNLIKEYFENA